MPKLTDENLARIRRLNEIADEIRYKVITPQEGEAEVQSILDIWNAEDSLPSTANDTPSDGVDK